MGSGAGCFSMSGPEADVEHAVGLVEHDVADAVEVQGAAGQVIEHAARGADDEIDALLQGAELLPMRVPP